MNLTLKTEEKKQDFFAFYRKNVENDRMLKVVCEVVSDRIELRWHGKLSTSYGVVDKQHTQEYPNQALKIICTRLVMLVTLMFDCHMSRKKTTQPYFYVQLFI